MQEGKKNRDNYTNKGEVMNELAGFVGGGGAASEVL